MQFSDPLKNAIRDGEPISAGHPREHLGASAVPLLGRQIPEIQVRFVMGTLTLALFVLACFLPVFLFSPGTMFGDCKFGIELLLAGWLGIFYGVIAWYANLLYLPALVLFHSGNYRVARWLGLAGTSIALTSLLVQKYHMMGLHGGQSKEIEGYGIGFYLWLGSFLLLTFASWWLARLVTSARPREVSLTEVK